MPGQGFSDNKTLTLNDQVLQYVDYSAGLWTRPSPRASCGGCFCIYIVSHGRAVLHKWRNQNRRDMGTDLESSGFHSLNYM